jgi:hypothetical protein
MVMAKQTIKIVLKINNNKILKQQKMFINGLNASYIIKLKIIFI